MVEPSLPSYRPTQRRAIMIPRGRYSRVSQSQVGAKQRALGAGVVRWSLDNNYVQTRAWEAAPSPEGDSEVRGAASPSPRR